MRSSGTCFFSTYLGMHESELAYLSVEEITLF